MKDRIYIVLFPFFVYDQRGNEIEMNKGDVLIVTDIMNLFRDTDQIIFFCREKFLTSHYRLGWFRSLLDEI